jgi:hypothetical protein
MLFHRGFEAVGLTPRRSALALAASVCLAASVDGCDGKSVVAPTGAVVSNISVTMNSYDPQGSGSNTKETYLTVSNVGSGSFGLLFSRAVDGDQSAQPLYAGGLKFADGSQKNVVFVATEHDSVYAFDADDASASAPIWQVSLGKSVPLPNPYFGRKTNKQLCEGSDAPFLESGITATPALDLSTQTIYVLALNEDDTHTIPNQTCLGADKGTDEYCETYKCTQPTIEYQLHALDMLTGAEKPGSPVVIEAIVSGSGSASQGGKISFSALLSLARSSLLVAYGNVYFATGSYVDAGDYHGWVFAYDAATLKQVAVYCDTRDGARGGIWQAGRGLLSDGKSLYVETGNGTFNINHGGHDVGDAVLRFDPQTLEVLDYFSPFFSDYDDQNLLDPLDIDLGSAGAILIPNTTLLMASGKMGIGYVVDTGNLGKWSPNGDKIVQEVRLSWRPEKKSCADKISGSEVLDSPILWQGPDGLHVYLWAGDDFLRGYLLDGSSRFQSEGLCFCKAPYKYFTGATIDVPDPPCGVPSSKGTEVSNTPGGSISLSSNGMKSGTAIVWATHAPTGSTNSIPTYGVLEAYDATDLTSPLWSTKTNGSSEPAWNWAKYAPPTIANGKVYVATFSKELNVYGLMN